MIKKYLVLITLAFIASFSFAVDSVQKINIKNLPDGEYVDYFDNKKVISSIVNIKNKKVIRVRLFDLSGKLSDDVKYNPNNNESYWIGYADGKKTSEGKKIDGLPDGLWIYYFDFKWQEINYKKGLRHGLTINYFDGKHKLDEAMYVNGKQDGLEIHYNRDGSVRSKIMYKNDKIVQTK